MKKFTLIMIIGLACLLEFSNLSQATLAGPEQQVIITNPANIKIDNDESVTITLQKHRASYRLPPRNRQKTISEISRCSGELHVIIDRAKGEIKNIGCIHTKLK